MTDSSELVEVTGCSECGHKFIEPYRPRPHSLFRSEVICPSCGKVFVVTWSILRDRNDSGGTLEDLTFRGLTEKRVYTRINQTTLGCFLDSSLVAWSFGY
ncbi:MAG: hypothetical protein P1Q69_17850 [Candidatus Thorarchaeota archaeon]|nr:hypothetical protein [Candidatus Thorarchaeota archaeon]